VSGNSPRITPGQEFQKNYIAREDPGVITGRFAAQLLITLLAKVPGLQLLTVAAGESALNVGCVRV
jgi:hypothetical protein